MRKIFVLLLSGLILSACGPQYKAIPTPLRLSTPVISLPTSFVLGDCTDARQSTPDPAEASLFAPVTKDEHILGSYGAYVTVLVYSDFQCAACANLAQLLKSYVKKYPQDVRVTFRHFPLESIHDKAALAAQASEAAHQQGKFWEIHDLLFIKQSEWVNLSPAQFQTWIIDQAETLGLDKLKFQADLFGPATETIIEKAWENGQKIKLPGAPMILVNGEIIKWQVNLFEQLEDIILLARLPQQQFGTCPPVVIDPLKQYTATLVTTRGVVSIKLFADRVPNMVNNFVFLARNGWYNKSPFFRVISGSLAQAGDPTGTGLGNPGYFIASEKNTSIFYDRAGMLGMSNSGLDTNGSQFFITLSAAPQFDSQYPIFGEVISGLEVISQLNPADPAEINPSPVPDTLISVSIEEK